MYLFICLCILFMQPADCDRVQLQPANWITNNKYIR